MMQAIVMARRRRAPGIEPPLQLYINLKMVGGVRKKEEGKQWKILKNA
jgi:hypothetical protein